MKNDIYYSLVKPFNQCEMMDGLEKISPKADKLPEWSQNIMSNYPLSTKVELFENKSYYRFLLVGVCGLIIDKETKTIQHIFTLPSKRKNGYAKGLISCAHLVLNGVNHSDNLTELGTKCFKK